MTNQYDTDASLEWLDILKLDLWEEVNVRKRGARVDIDDLVGNIKENGLLAPLLVKKNGDRYQVFSGQRRLLACTKAGMTRIPCRIFTDITEEKARVLSLSENIYRRDMDIEDRTNAVALLLHSFGDKNEVARVLGISVQTVYNYLGYSALPDDIKKHVGGRAITRSQALQIFKKFEVEKAIEIANELAKIPLDERKKRRQYYTAIVDADKNDSIDKIITAAQRANDFVKYTLLLPKKKSEILNRIAENTLVDKETVALDMLMTQIDIQERRLRQR